MTAPLFVIQSANRDSDSSLTFTALPDGSVEVEMTVDTNNVDPGGLIYSDTLRLTRAMLANLRIALTAAGYR